MNSLKELHWLSVKYSVKYKIITITHKFLYGNTPAYLKEKVKLVDCNNRYSMRSNVDSQKLNVSPMVTGLLVSMPLNTEI